MELYDELFERFFKKEGQINGYQTEREYWKDLYAIFDFMILAALRQKSVSEGDGNEQELNRILFLLTGSGDRKKFADWKLDIGKIRVFLEQAEKHIENRKSRTDANILFRLPYLVRCFDLNEWEFFLLLAAFADNYDVKYGMIFSYLQGEASAKNPSLWLLTALYQLRNTLPEEYLSATLQKKGHFYESCLQCFESAGKNPMERTIVLQERVCAFLYGRNELSKELKKLVRIFAFSDPADELIIRKEYKQKLQHIMRNMFSDDGKMGKVLQLYGMKGIGKHFLLKLVAKEWNTNLLFVDVGKLLRLSLEEQQQIFSKLTLESILTGSVVCMEGYEQAEEASQRQQEPLGLRFLIENIRSSYRASVWLSEEKADFLLGQQLHVVYMELPILSVREREFLWRSEIKRYSLSKQIDLQRVANQYILTPKSIQEVLWDAQLHAQGEITAEDIRQAVSCQVRNQLGGSAARVRSIYTWDDLVVDAVQREQMEMICNQVKYRSIVGEEWGFYRKTSYGRGICAMFYGAPGTGKTMAAQVMANELGLELYRIDLSQIVSKYIGETQKNITELFKRAKNTNALLFFDEADSLFAKRSEVKDSHDRNANAETAHLLQKLEDYEGITILATNYINNIDEAFKRRIKFMVNFVFPTPDVRLKLWQTILPKKTPREEELDLPFFAQNFELSGSSIKEVLTNAAFCAAAEGRGLCNRDLVLAVKQNFAKYGKVLTDEDFGYLA